MTLERTVMREQIKELIIQRILEGTYKPGERVVELQLVQELGVSQAPVREALRDLEAMRFIESEPYRGARVRQVTREELTETLPGPGGPRGARRQHGRPGRGRRDAPACWRPRSRTCSRPHATRTSTACSSTTHGSTRSSSKRPATPSCSTPGSGLRIEAYTLVASSSPSSTWSRSPTPTCPILDALRQRDADLTGKVMREHIEHFGIDPVWRNPMTETPLVLHVHDERCRDVDLAGGKGASLASMTANGLPVPPGFVITSPAFAEVGRRREAAVQPQGPGPRRRPGRGRRDRAAAGPDQGAATTSFPQGASVAVRSSACAEDSNDASYAGQQETYLFVETFDEVMEKVVECWLSFFSERALFYREHKGDLDDIQMAVVVQQMVDANKAGVMFTVDPVNHRKDRVVVEAAFGIGENVVSGEVTPDYYTLDRKGALKKARVVDEQVLSESELADLVKMGLHLADLNGGPQDIEWAYDDTGLFMLQSGPSPRCDPARDRDGTRRHVVQPRTKTARRRRTS